MAFRTETPPDDVRLTDRTVGDLVDPYRTQSATDIVNAVSRDIGADAADWSVVRLLRLGAQIEAEARQMRQG